MVVGPRTGRYRTGILQLGPWNTVTNSDVAGFMLRCLDDPTTVGTARMIAAADPLAGSQVRPGR